MKRPPGEGAAASLAPGPVPPFSGELRDGTKVRLRRALPSDRPRVLEFLTHVSRDSLERRFFSTVTSETVASEIVEPHPSSDRVSLLLEIAPPEGGPIIAHGEYERGAADPTRAEVVFLVADPWQAHGAATLLLLRLAHLAASIGVQQLEAVTLAENQPMIDVFLGCGYPCSITWHLGEGLVLLDIGHEPEPPGFPRGDPREHPLLSS
ncbi:MAG: hypothetical protein ACLQD8_08840 [Thermoplasmata archaeon]